MLMPTFDPAWQWSSGAWSSGSGAGGSLSASPGTCITCNILQISTKISMRLQGLSLVLWCLPMRASASASAASSARCWSRSQTLSRTRSRWSAPRTCCTGSTSATSCGSPDKDKEKWVFPDIELSNHKKLVLIGACPEIGSTVCLAKI